ncbi:NADH-ubiquinone oxidoreductase 12 kDa subunit [Trametopsis cervina]|nr:NADH-ubiquinone oxidoreductase 12 kDa subunit [Trametopsis cervina]
MASQDVRTAELTRKLKEREDTIRESWIRTMEARLVRDNLQKCYRSEGVNHLENCKELAERYADMLRDHRVQGYKHIDV